MIFRRTISDLRKEGALWDQAKELYSKTGARTLETLRVQFTGGMRIQFGHMEHEKNKFDWQGAQFSFAGFDEVTHFTEGQFFYILSRLRSVSGVRGYIRATCNPDPDSWVRNFLAWWIDPITGLAIEERSGVIRYFIRDGDAFVWADKISEFPEDRRQYAKSVTFIRSRLEDNKLLMKKDPTYAASLEALPYVDRMRLKEGNWNIRATAGTMFRRPWIEIVDALPSDLRAVRYWDRAASIALTAAYTAGVKLGRSPGGIFYVMDVVRERATPGGVETMIKNTANNDGKDCTVGIEQDPGQAGVAEASGYTRLLAGYNVKVVIARHDKVTRAKPASAQVEAGNVKVLRAPWTEDFIRELEAFPDGKFKDQVDAFSGAMYLHTEGMTGTFTKDMTKGRVGNVAPSRRGNDLW